MIVAVSLSDPTSSLLSDHLVSRTPATYTSILTSTAMEAASLGVQQSAMVADTAPAALHGALQPNGGPRCAGSRTSGAAAR